nr:conserved hypothetical protein [Albugo laibachii Nc14]|eukprot:CCA18359.1 conserved hypothetical protein [Albugo laibachii Nc14]
MLPLHWACTEPKFLSRLSPIIHDPVLQGIHSDSALYHAEEVSPYRKFTIYECSQVSSIHKILHQSIMSSEKSILSCAEQADWNGVLGLLETEKSLARTADEFNMLPLHWACTEPSIPIETLDKIINAFPLACELPNFSGMLPLHVAIKNNLLGVHIKAIVKAFPEATILPDGNGRYAVELAMENSLPSFTTEWIRKTASSVGKISTATSYDYKRMLQRDNQTGHSSDCSTRSIMPMLVDTGSSGSFNQVRHSESLNPSSVYPNDDEFPDTGQSVSTHSINICRQLGDLVTQLQLLGSEIRSSASSSTSTCRSSSSGLSLNANLTHDRMDVLWNPSDKLGIVFEPLNGNVGARILKINSKSTALGVEALHHGNILLRINDIVVTKAAHASITRFLKHVRVACTLTFVSSTSSSAASAASSHPVLRRISQQGSKAMSVSKEDSFTSQSHRPSLESDLETRDIYLRVTEMLDRTLRQVSSVEANVRLSIRAP